MSGFRLALGLFTVFPVGRLQPDARSAARAVLWMPVVGLSIGFAAALPALLVWHGNGDGSTTVAATVVISAQALLTRGLHLDGLADLADGLGSGRRAEGALAVMRQPDIGPFGVTAVLLSLFLQVTALSAILSSHHLPFGLIAIAAVAMTGRLAVVWSAGRGIRPARPDGFGALVAGSIGAAGRIVSIAWVLVAALGAAALARASAVELGWLAGAVVGGLLGAWIVRRHAVRRFGGITGDVFGAVVEVASTVTLLVLAAESAWR
jgi:adenosylcobinamide-GDP ribazoletransferase